MKPMDELRMVGLRDKKNGFRREQVRDHLYVVADQIRHRDNSGTPTYDDVVSVVDELFRPWALGG